MSNYTIGRYFEYKERDYWRAQGWWSHRQYGSYGVFDVVATDGRSTLFIQVKSVKKGKVTPSTIRAAKTLLKEIPKGPGVILMVVCYEGRPAKRREIIV